MTESIEENAVLETPDQALAPYWSLETLRRLGKNSRQFLRAVGLTLLAGAMLYALIEFKLVLFSEYLQSSAGWWWKMYSIVTSAFLLSRFVILDFYRDHHSRVYTAAAYPSVSFVIAAKNEEAVIRRTINTCLRSNYPGNLECIVINDGSTDKTGEQIDLAAVDWRSHPGGLKVIDFPVNRGKREGMAAGVKEARGDIIVFVDSDSFVQPAAVKTLVEHFIRDHRVGAVTGETGVENKNKNILTKMESARYGISYNIFKAAESVFGTVTCCAGCFSAYRKSALQPILNRWLNQKFFGSPSTFGDDRSLTNFVLRKWRVEYCRSAKATTVVPEKFSVFLRQQFRWKKSWIREGLVASSIMWRKHPIAALSFYTQLLLPIFGPFVAFHGLILAPFVNSVLPFTYLLGIVGMSLLFGLIYYRQSLNTRWPYVSVFSLVYVFILVWQMPYALVRIMDTKWGTR